VLVEGDLRAVEKDTGAADLTLLCEKARVAKKLRWIVLRQPCEFRLAPAPKPGCSLLQRRT